MPMIKKTSPKHWWHYVRVVRTLASKNFSEREIAAKIGLSKSKVHKIKCVGTLLPMYLNTHRKFGTDLSTLVVLSKHLENDELCNKILAGEITTYSQSLNFLGLKRFI